jgi:intein/homing endonuclease
MANKSRNKTRVGHPVKHVDVQSVPTRQLTKLEKQARREASQSIRVAMISSGGFSGYGNNGSGSISAADSQFYSPQLSTDFLELPQSEREKRELFRFWYNVHPIVGAAIDFHCFPPGAPVMMKDGSVNSIESLSVGDEVINGFGESTKVIQTFKHDICGPVTRLKVQNIQGDIDCTENHPFLVYRAEQIDYKPSQHSLDFGKPGFVFAKDLKIGDYICSPSLVNSESIFNRAQLRLLGYYAAEGSLSYTKYDKLDKVIFSLNIDKFDSIANEIVELFGNEYKHVAQKREQKDCSVCEVRCYKKDFAEFCLKHVGSESLYKQLSLDIIDSAREDILEFLGAYWNGDGSLTKSGYVATTISKQLAHQIYALALKVGYAPTLHRHEPEDSDTDFKSNSSIYRIIIPYRFHSEFSRYANFVQDGYHSDSTRENCIQINNNVLRRIEKVGTVQYDGPVYNIEVDGDGDRKSYIAYGLATHNTDVPMSKIRLSLPKGKDPKRNKQILHFYQEMCKRVRLFQTLYDATHEYWLHGGVFIFCEDHDLHNEIPEDLISDITEEEIGEIDYAGRSNTKKIKTRKPKPENEQQTAILKYVQDNYLGWERLQILPPEQVKLEVFQYTNKSRMELIPSEKDRLLVLRAEDTKDPEAVRIANDIPEEIRNNLLNGQPIPLNTSPYEEFLCSSFCYYLAHKRSAYNDRGISILERCHLPGTEITALRNGEVLQIPIEELDPQTDQVLGGSGNWRSFQHGSRQYSGKTVGLQICKLPNIIWSTSDHKIRILRDNQFLDVEAQNARPGDYIEIAHINADLVLHDFDLNTFFNSEQWTFNCRRTKTKHALSISADIHDGELILTHRRTDNNPQRDMRSQILVQICDWIRNLDSPIDMLYATFQEKFGIAGKSVYRAILKDLSKLGYLTVCVQSDSTYKSQARRFHRADLDPRPLYELNYVQFCPKSLELTADLGYFIGYYLGDGWTESNRPSATKYGPTGICWQQDSEASAKSVAFIFDVLKNLGLDLQSHEYELGWLQIHDDWFSRWVGRNFGHNKSDKKLPNWIHSTSPEFKFGILRGLIDSDGWKSTGRTGCHSASIAMTTKQLVDHIFVLTNTIGLNPSLKKSVKTKPARQANGSFCINTKPLYTIAFNLQSDIFRLQQSGFSSKLFDLCIDRYQSKLGLKSKVFEGHNYYQIREVLTNEFSGPVFSLEVNQDHSFYAGLARTHNCLRTLNYQDKLRQAQSSIASRAMTPKRIVWADKASSMDIDGIRDQVDQALIDPDFTIVSNFELHWDEIGSRDRLLDLSTEYEITNKLLFIGLRITESMLTGESTYSGERIHLDVMNTMYLLYRDMVSTFVEDYLFAPVAEKKGYVEEDEYGNRQLLYPKLQFTRLALRDNSELQDFMFNLYSKGSMPISYIYDLINIDVDDAHAELQKDAFTLKDANMNELIRTLLSAAGEQLLDDSDIKDRLIKNLGLVSKKKEGDRYTE